MIRVLIYKKGNENPYQNVCKDMQEAEEWVKNHKAKGKDATIITSPNKIEGAKLLEEVDGPMGVKLLKQEFPADYTVEYIDESKIEEEAKYDPKAERLALIKERNRILCATDWLLLPDVKLDQKHRRMYVEYRQLLRDLPRKIGDYSEVKIETFPNWLRRNYPEEFMDGGKAEKIIKIFGAYL